MSCYLKYLEIKWNDTSIWNPWEFQGIPNFISNNYTMVQFSVLLVYRLKSDGKIWQETLSRSCSEWEKKCLIIIPLFLSVEVVGCGSSKDVRCLYLYCCQPEWQRGIPARGRLPRRQYVPEAHMPVRRLWVLAVYDFVGCVNYGCELHELRVLVHRDVMNPSHHLTLVFMLNVIAHYIGIGWMGPSGASKTISISNGPTRKPRKMPPIVARLPKVTSPMIQEIKNQTNAGILFEYSAGGLKIRTSTPADHQSVCKIS